MSSERRSNTFIFTPRTSKNVRFETNEAFQFNNNIELGQPDLHMKLGSNWRVKQVGQNLVFQYSQDGKSNWITKSELAP